MNNTLALRVEDPSQAGEARRLVAQWGRDFAWDEDLAGRVALVVTELGRNLALHTAGGSLLLRRLVRGTAHGLEILAADGGPGTASFHEWLRDGFSSAGTAGIGLGAVQRTSDRFAVHSQPGVGTVLLSEIWPRGGEPPTPAWDLGAVNVPYGSETVCGDSWNLLSLPGGAARVLVADGLGHGEFAAQASRRAVEVFRAGAACTLPELLARIHDALRGTRGAAVAMAELHPREKTLSFAGVGNVAGALVDGSAATSLVSMNGTVGAQLRTVRCFSYPLPPGAVLIMASDGLKSQWQLPRYLGLLERPAPLIAAALWRDCARQSDDSTVIALRAAP